MSTATVSWVLQRLAVSMSSRPSHHRADVSLRVRRLGELIRIDLANLVHELESTLGAESLARAGLQAGGFDAGHGADLVIV